MARFNVRTATIADCALIGPHVRKEDWDECMAACGKTPQEALEYGFPFSSKAWVGEMDGKVIVIAGVGHVKEYPWIGVPWMMSTPEMDKHAIAFLRENRWVVDEMCGDYQLLANFVDARNKKAIRWLEWLGFTMMPAEPYGVEGLPFHQFRMEL